MTTPTFTRATGDPRLYWLDGATWAPSGAFGLVLFAGGSGTPPATLSLAESFSTWPGCYVTLATKPAAAAEPAFATAVLALCARLGPAARFAWLETGDPDDQWARRILYVAQAGGATQGTIDRPSVFSIGRYRFSVSAGQTIAPTADGFAITGTVGPAFQLLTDADAWAYAPAAAGATTLSASGATAGTFTVDGSLDAAADPAGLSDYDRLDVGFRYGLDDQDDADGNFLTSLRYPLFRGAAAATPVPVTLQVDPAGLTEPTRTRIAYRGTIAALATHYTSRLGYGVTMAPVTTAPAAGLPAGFAFHRRPEARDALPADDPLYLAPIGPFTLTIAGPPIDDPVAVRLTGGMSGSEYFGFSSGAQVPIAFTPQQAAFAPDFPPRVAATIPSPVPSPAVPASLTARATTSFALLGAPPSGNGWYFAQPEGAAFFHVADGAREPQIPYLTGLELVVGTLGATAAPYPLVPYAGSGGNDLTLVRALEQQVLNPLRRAALGVPGERSSLTAAATAPGDGPTQAVTPQGILATFSGSTWSSVIVSPARVGEVLPQLAFNAPGAAFRGALQSNQLFLVATDGAALMAAADFNYWITDAVLGDLARLSGTDAVPKRVIDLLGRSARAPQTSRAAFTALLTGLLTGADARYVPTIVKHAVYFELDVAGWRFRLSPSLWADRTVDKPIMILKYAAGPLWDLVQNTDAWAWPAVAGAPAETRAAINAVLHAATAEVDARGEASDLYRFVTDVVRNPAWTGLVVLNADVPFSSVPAELAGLAAGIDPARFRAHHVGVSVTPVAVDTGAKSLAQGPSAVFGLIDYDQGEHLAHVDGDFDFKVLLLRVLFVNSTIADFAGRIELFVNRLFAERVTLYASDHYNNVVLDGSYQRQGASGHYLFASRAANVFGADTAGLGGSTDHTVLLETQIDQAQFVTATLDPVADPVVRNRFLLQGKLRFAALAGFDAFSFGPTLDRNGATVADGYLAFAGLSVDMTFPVASPLDKTFTLDVDELVFDPASSVARATSFFRRFPLRLGGLQHGSADRKPGDLGYLPVDTPLAQPGFSRDWFGLPMTVDLGTLGALSSAPALSGTVLAAWSPGNRGHDVNVGLRMPGLESARAILPLQGVVDLGFQSIDLQAPGATASPPDPAYTLRFRNFYLRFLGWKFPPGQNSITLFGNPDIAGRSIASDRGALGWYAAYAKGD